MIDMDLYFYKKINMYKQQLEKRIRDCDNKILKINNWEYPHLRHPEDIKKTLLATILHCEEKIFTISLT